MPLNSILKWPLNSFSNACIEQQQASKLTAFPPLEKMFYHNNIGGKYIEDLTRMLLIY